MGAYSAPPKTRILLAVTPDLRGRFRRILDESQMFTLLGDIRAHSAYRKIPILCVLGQRGRVSEVAIEGLDHAVKAMRANGFLDLQHFPDDEAGNARIRRIVDYLILIDGDLQHITSAPGPRR